MSMRVIIAFVVVAALAAGAAIVMHRHGNAGSPPPAAHDDVDYWTCSMHPSVHSAGPGKCPICSMDLIPVHKSGAEAVEVEVPTERRQALGIRTEAIANAPMALEVRAVGRVAFDETALTEISLRVGGWVTTVSPAVVGSTVAAGDPLLRLVSPEIAAAQRELLLAAQPGAAGGPELLHAARERLRLWNQSEAQIDALIAAREVPPSVEILAPVAGCVIEKSVLAGATVSAGQVLYRLADPRRVWVLADVTEADLSAVKVGQEVALTVATFPGERFAGRVDLVAPALDPATRSARARIVLDRPDPRLRPEMYATATMAVPLGDRLQVPKSAVIVTGPRRLVFVDAGGGRLRPRPVTLGASGSDTYEVVAGLTAGEVVVTSGTFLIAAESRIRSAEAAWGGDDAGH